MSDFQNLSPQLQSLLQIKLDGFIEACMHVARIHNIGLSEALRLTIQAMMREINAHKFNPEKADALWEEALGSYSLPSPNPESPRLN